MIVIGDVHGNYETLMRLIEQFPKDAEFCFVGDLVDRGPGGRKVVEFVKNGNYDCCLGNHEDFMSNNELFFLWLHPMNGGITTVRSYNLWDDSYREEQKSDEEMFFVHQEWMRQLPVCLEYPDLKNKDGRHLLVSHSSAGPVWDLRFSETEHHVFREKIIWGRSALEDKNIPGIYNIFGHTIQLNGPKISAEFACIDTGAFFVNLPNTGILTAVQFPEMKIYTQKNVDMVSNEPFTMW